MRFFFLAASETQRAGAGLFFRVRQVERLAVLATVDFHVGAELFFTSSPKKYQRLRWPAHSFSLASFSLQARMRGVRSFTLVPSLSVSTSSDTGTGLSEAAYFGFAIFRMTSITGGTPGQGCPRHRLFMPPAYNFCSEEPYRDAAMDSRSRVGPTGHPRPDPGSTQRPGTLGGYLGHGPNARPAGPGQRPPRRRRRRPPAPPPPRRPIAARGLNNQTVRMIVRTSIGGRRLRVRLSNAFGGTPVVVGAAHLAIRAKDSAIVPDSDRSLSFNGKPGGTIAPGRGAAQRSGGAQRAAGDGARREPLLPRRDRPSHHALHRPAQHLHLEGRGPDRAGRDSRTRHHAVLLLAGRRRRGGGRRRRGPGHLRRLHYRRRALHQRRPITVGRPCWRRAWRPTKRRRTSAWPTWGSAAIACCATAAAPVPWRASIAMCSASRGSSG
jgi:hypothetical protein